jgi:hypothetical protein
LCCSDGPSIANAKKKMRPQAAFTGAARTSCDVGAGAGEDSVPLQRLYLSSVPVANATLPGPLPLRGAGVQTSNVA